MTSINLTTALRRTALGLALGLSAIAATSAAHAQTAVKFSLDWKFEGPSSPFLVAIDKGYFNAEGLDVTIDTGAGSVEPLNRLAGGSYDMAFGDINSLVKFLDKNPSTKIKGVFMLYNNPPFAVVGRKSKGVNSPKDLEGKKLGAPVADGAYAQWPIFVAANKIDASKVQVQNIGFPVREPMLITGDVDAITGFAFSSYLNVAKNVPKGDATVFLMAEYGVKLYGNAIMVHPKFAAEKPEAVKGFLRAFVKGLKDVVANPEAAMASVLPRNPVAKKDDELERLNYALEKNILTDEVKANGYGGIDNARMEVALEQIATTYSFEKKPKVEDIFDASFLPPATMRSVK